MEVTQYPRIEELRRRVQKDPTSIAFAQLAEEYRRTGNYEAAITTCRTGLAHHPSYLSARVTLGRALMELHRYNDARTELETVLDLASDNLAAIRGLAEIHQRRGEAGDTSPVDHPPTAAPQPLEALDALDALTLDMPPAPDLSPLSLDIRLQVPDEPLVASPGVEIQYQIPNEPHAAPPHVDMQLQDPEEPSVALPGQEESFAVPISNPAIAELERWLAAIVEDRSHQQ
jgi:tetratricopeptide (TPR) repeat protein